MDTNKENNNSVNIEEKIQTLPYEIKAAMGSYSAEQNQQIADTFSLKGEQIPRMVRVIARTILEIIPLNNFVRELKNAFPEFDEDKLKNLAVQILVVRFLPLRNYIKGIEGLIIELGGKIPGVMPDLPRFPEEKEEEIEKTEAQKPITRKTINLPISQAMQKYPRLGEQLVTGNPIKLKIFPEPVRPSIKNWIAEYHQVLGAGSHGTMERGNFLYHSENGKRLTAGERQKLAVILKSLDENEPISVDAEKQEIVFRPTTNNQQPTTDSKISNFQFPISNKNPKSEYRNPKQIQNPNPKIQNYFSGQANEVPTLSRDSDRSVGTSKDYHFSYPQRLQSERPQPKSYGHFDPYHIDPVGYPEDKPKPEPPKPPALPSASRTEPKINGNVVDLRN